MARTNTPAARSLDVADVVAELGNAPARGHARKSRLYLWLQENHDHLVREFERNSPSWNRLATILGARGILDGNGKPPTARGARGAWYRVRRDVAAALEKKASREQPAATGIHRIAAEQLSALPSAPPVSIQLDEGEPERPRFKLASLRNATAADGPPPATGRMPPTAPEPAPPNPQRFDDVMAEFLGQTPKHPTGDE